MRFIVAIVLFVVAFVGIGLGIAQRTVLAGPDSFTARHDEIASAPLTLVSGATLSALPGTQTISLASEGPVFMSYGRTDDVLAWIGDASYQELQWDPEAEALVGDHHSGSAETVPNPAGSDLWVQEFSGVDELTRKLNIPATASLLIASDGTAGAPSQIAISWPLDNSAPLSGPLIIGGTVALLLGLVAFVWAGIETFRTRGPRRRQPRLPKPPQPPQLKPAKKRKAIEAGAGSSSSSRRRFVSVGILGAALVLGGCAPTTLPAVVPTPAGTAPIEAAEELPPPAVTEAQLSRIVERITTTVAEADAAQNTNIAKTRLDGPALAVRSANYTIQKRDSKQAPLAPLPTGEVRVSLPQQTATWPRTVFAVVTDDEATVAPVALMLIQDSPRENYRLHYALTLEPNTVLPQVAAATIGAPRVPADSHLGLLAPNQLAIAYGDVLIKGADSEYIDYFNQDSDSLVAQIGADYKAAKAAEFRKVHGTSGKLSFRNEPGAAEPIAFGTNDAGLIVAVELIEIERAEPNESGAAINPKGAARALFGKSQTTKGMETSYSVQLLFYVPPLGGDTTQIELLGYVQGIVATREL